MERQNYWIKILLLILLIFRLGIVGMYVYLAIIYIIPILIALYIPLVSAFLVAIIGVAKNEKYGSIIAIIIASIEIILSFVTFLFIVAFIYIVILVLAVLELKEIKTYQPLSYQQPVHHQPVNQHSFSSQETVNYCPNCGSPARGRYCTQCGSILRQY